VTDGSIHAWFDLERVGAAALAYEANKLLVIENVQVAPRQDGEVCIKIFSALPDSLRPLIR
jgi:hypothetical protein